MKFAAAILIALVLTVQYGSAPVAASGNGSGALSADVANPLLDGIRNLLTAALKFIFSEVDNLLLLLFNGLLRLTTIFAQWNLLLPLDRLLPPLLALDNPVLSTVAAALFDLLGVDGTPILKLVPVPIGKTPINLYKLLELAAPSLKGLNILLIDLLNAVALYLVKYFYSLRFP